jgi:tetratricopeptide (TPR) repeat protein
MRNALRAALIPAALAALSACATAPPKASSPPVAARDDSSGGSIYGLYLAGHGALDAGDSRAAADFFAKAGQQDPAAGFVKEQVFIAALLSGDIPRAAANAPGPTEGSPDSQALGGLTRAVEALASGRGAEAYDLLTHGLGASTEPAALLRPWAAAAAGKVPESLAIPANGERLYRLIGSLDQAMLYERARRYSEAETAYKALLSDRLAGPLVLPPYAAFLERRGRKADARAVYDQILAADPQDPAALAGRARVQSGGKPPEAPSVRQGAAQALMGPAAALIAQHQPELGLSYLRMVQRLDPGRDEAWLLAGDVMSTSGDLVAAREAFSQVGPKSPRYAEARTRLAWTYQNDGQTEQALHVAREAVSARPDSDNAKLALADLLRAANRFEESARVLDPLIAAAGPKGDWRLFYMRAVALERSGHWPEAEQDLKKALALNPDQPEIENYLGYSWVNRGERVKEGLALIQRAVDAQPQEGAYVDSLGWAFYRLGQYDKAVETLERAISLDASDSEINEHLGDAYWRVGRRNEAVFQWKAVLTLQPDEETRARVTSKINSPLGPDVIAKGAAVAAR